MGCTKCQIGICLPCSCVLGTISFVAPVFSTVNRGKFTSSLVHHFQDLSTGCTLHCPLSRRGREGFEPFSHLYALNVIASTSRFLVFLIILGSMAIAEYGSCSRHRRLVRAARRAGATQISCAAPVVQPSEFIRSTTGTHFLRP